MGTHVLLESAKLAKISRFIHVSTDEVYGEQTMDQDAMSEEQVCRMNGYWFIIDKYQLTINFKRY
jgi:dTDP-glucose 4,6-dehydratase